MILTLRLNNGKIKNIEKDSDNQIVRIEIQEYENLNSYAFIESINIWLNENSNDDVNNPAFAYANIRVKKDYRILIEKMNFYKTIKERKKIRKEMLKGEI